MINFKNFCKVFLASSLLLSCVDQKLQQVAVSSPQTNIGGGNINGNQVNTTGNVNTINTGDKSQINVGGSATVSVNKPSPIIDSFNLLETVPLIKPGYSGSYYGTPIIQEPYVSSKMSYNSIKKTKIRIQGKNFNTNNLKVVFEFNYPISFSAENRLKVDFDIIEKSDSQIIAQFPTKFQLPQPSADFLEQKYKSYITPLPTPAPGEIIESSSSRHNYLPIQKCLEPVPTFNWSFNWFSVETSSGKVNSSSNPPQVTYLPEDMTYEDYQTECALWEELKDFIGERVLNSIYILSEDGKKKSLALPKNFPISELVTNQPDLSKYKGLSVDKPAITLRVNESSQIKPNYILHTNELEPISDPSILNWTSSDKTIISVSDSGLIVAKKSGVATVLVKIGNIGYNIIVSVNN